MVTLLSSASSIISSWVLFTGDLNGYWKPSNVPNDYIYANKIMREVPNKTYHALWLPVFGSKKAIWINATSPYGKPPTGIFALRSSYLPTYLYINIYFFDYYNPIGVRPLYRLLECYSGGDWGKILAPLNIKYLVIHYDIRDEDITRIKQVAEKLKKDNSLSLLFEGKYLSVYAMNNAFPLFYIKNLAAVSAKGLSIHASLDNFLSNVSLLYLDQKLIDPECLHNIKYLISDASKSSFYSYSLAAISDSKHIVVLGPNKHVVRISNPENSWAYGSSVSDYGYQRYLYHKEIKWAWQSDYGYGLVFTWAKNTKLKIPFKVDKTDNYKLFIRYFKNQKGGEISVNLDDKSIKINTTDQLNKFVWRDLGTFKLKAGKHRLVIENIKGFNAVNLFVLIPNQEYYKVQKEVKNLLQNKTLIYLFEAESDLYHSHTKTIKNINASNGELIAFGNESRAWQEIEIIKNGTYRIALKGIGKFNINISNKSFTLSSNTLNFTYSPIFYLKEGKYKLEIATNNNSKLDAIWLYSSNKTIDQLFEVKQKPAEIITYKKINPTLWKVKVNATKPFLLSFAESYDPLWEARVYKKGTKVETIKAIPLYSVINGFWINETGNLEIILRYKPQDWFEIGLAISITTFIGSIIYLIYDLIKRRRKNGQGS